MSEWNRRGVGVRKRDTWHGESEEWALIDLASGAFIRTGLRSEAEAQALGEWTVEQTWFADLGPFRAALFSSAKPPGGAEIVASITAKLREIRDKDPAVIAARAELAKIDVRAAERALAKAEAEVLAAERALAEAQRPMHEIERLKKVIGDG